MGAQNNNSLSDLLQQYTSPESDIANAYMRSFARGGPIDVPSHQELYQSYRNVAETEADRQSARLREAYGSRGARYGSDMLNAQAGLRRDLTNDLTARSGDLLQNLRKQQFSEAGALVNYDFGRNEAGMARLFQDFLRRTSPGPLFDAGVGLLPTNYGSPTTFA